MISIDDFIDDSMKRREWWGSWDHNIQGWKRSCLTYRFSRV